MTALDTIFALSSGLPPAAIAIVRISGGEAHRAAGALCGQLPAARRAELRQLRQSPSGELLDEALVLRFDGPASATGEDLVEFHCHGGRAVVEAVLTALAAQPGLRRAEPGEFTRRALLNGRIDLTEAEGLADLLAAETEVQRKAALRMAGGALRSAVERWRDLVLAEAAAAELAIDYVGEDEAVGGASGPALATLARELDEWLARPRAEPLRDGVRVVIAGPANSGKSSLLNAIVGYERAIVTPVEGTTRDHLDVHLALAGLPFVFTDTAGLRQTGDAIEQCGIDRARQLLAGADILVWLGPVDEAPAHPFLLLIRAKADLEPSDPRDHRAAVSAVTGIGIPALLARIVETARNILPAEQDNALNRRQADELVKLAAAVRNAAATADPLLRAEELRYAREAIDRLSGRAGFDDFLDALFSRFCLGK